MAQVLDPRVQWLDLARTINELQRMGNTVSLIRARIRHMEALYRTIGNSLNEASLRQLIHGIQIVATLLSHVTNKYEQNIVLRQLDPPDEEE